MFENYLKISVVLPGLIVLGLLLPATAGAQSDPDKPQMVDLWQPGDSGQRMRIRGRVRCPTW